MKDRGLRTHADDVLGALVEGPAELIAGAIDGVLGGRTFVAKDVFAVAGRRTGAGNPDWEADAPVEARSADAVERAVAAGATLVGRSVTDELAYSLSGTNVHFGTPVNVNAPGRVPGGSSAGSAAAVAGALCDFALGTDTGGSGRVPASYCGVIGVRPTHGRIPIGGVVHLAPRFDTVAWFARDPSLTAAAGSVLLDGWRADTTPPRRLAVAADALAVVDADARTAFELALADLPVTHEVELAGGEPDGLATWRGAFFALQRQAAWATHGAWITRRHPHFGPGIEARFAAASAVTAVEVAAGEATATRVRARLAELTRDGTAIVLPTTSSVAPPLDASDERKAVVRDGTMALTCTAGLAGAPAVSLPLASVTGLPLGVCLLGAPGSDEELLALAADVATEGTTR
jgi:amidase